MAREPNFWRPLPTLTFDDVQSLQAGELPELTQLDYKSIDVFQKASGGKGNSNSKGKGSTIAGDLCALANAGGGRIVYGAETDKADRSIVAFRGVPLDGLKAVTATIRNAAHLVDPPVALETKALQIEDKDEFVVVAEANPMGTGPHQGPDRRYPIRSGDGTTYMSHAMITSSIRTGMSTEDRDTDLGLYAPLAEDLFRIENVSVFFGVHVHGASSLGRSLWDAGRNEELDELLATMRGLSLKPVPMRRGMDYTNGQLVKGHIGYNANCWEVTALARREFDGVFKLSDLTDEQRKRMASGALASPTEVWIKKIGQQVAGAIWRFAHVVSAFAPSLRLAVRARLWTGQSLILRRGHGEREERAELKPFSVVQDGEFLGEALAGDLCEPSGPSREMGERFDQLVFLSGNRIEPPEGPNTPKPPSATLIGPDGREKQS